MKSIVKILGIASLVITVACTKEPLPNINDSTSRNGNVPTPPTNPTGSAAASLIITENNDSVFVADSAYWEYTSPNSAILKAYASGGRSLELYVGDPLVSKEWIIDPQGMAVYYFNNQVSYGTSYAQSIFINAVQGNLISGNFDHQMVGTYYQVLPNGSPTYTFVNEKRVKVEFENIPQKL